MRITLAVAAVMLCGAQGWAADKTAPTDEHPIDQLVVEICPNAKLTIDHPHPRYAHAHFRCNANGFPEIVDQPEEK